jgi:cell wall-associated NlpC family hydrolase
VRVLVSVLPVLLVAACASAPQSVRVKGTAADDAAHHATTMLGKPYRYRGASPSQGFDCSGLVQFSYHRAGVAVPRSTELQRKASRPVPLSEARRGDLLFFSQDGKKYGHVAIYIGYGKFVHAPSSGKNVRSDWLDSPYWRKHFTGARRLA